MPNACIDMRRNIWKMNAAEFGSERAYLYDFEIYDERRAALSNAVQIYTLQLTASFSEAAHA